MKQTELLVCLYAIFALYLFRWELATWLSRQFPKRFQVDSLPDGRGVVKMQLRIPLPLPEQLIRLFKKTS